MHIRYQRRLKQYSWIETDHELKKSLHQIDLQETIVLRIKRERESHLATTYGPVGLWWTTHASSERHQ